MGTSQIPPAFFSPPTLREAPRPDWVLMDKLGYIAKRENRTTAHGLSSDGDVVVEVSFCLADPPAISYMCVHLPGLVERVNSGFGSVPAVVATGGAFVLFELSFCRDGGRRHYFVYKAGPGKPRLRPLPMDPTRGEICPWEIGILPLGCGDGKDDFIVAALVPYIGRQDRPPFDLCIFSPRSDSWRTVVPRVDPLCEEKVYSHYSSKVIMVGGGFLGWVDTWRGILLCNVLDKDPVLHLVPLPKPARAARQWKSNPEIIRGLVSDGNYKLSFVEIQFPKDLSVSDDIPLTYFDPSKHFDIQSDSDSDSDSDTADPGYLSDGWRATTWKRTLFSPDDDQWSKDCTADSDDILEIDHTCNQLLPELWDVEAGRVSLKNMYSQAPVLSMHDDGDGVVYMISELDDPDNEGVWVAAFDVRNKRLKALAPFSSKRTSSYEGYCTPCSFSMYFGAAPGLEPSVDFISREKTLDFYVLALLCIQDKLKGFEANFIEESNGRPLLWSIRATSMLASIRRFVQYAPRYDEDEAVREAIANCIQNLSNLEQWLVLESKTILPSRSTNTLSTLIYSSHRAIDSLLQILYPVTSEGSYSSRHPCFSLGVESEENTGSELGPQLQNIAIF